MVGRDYNLAAPAHGSVASGRGASELPAALTCQNLPAPFRALRNSVLQLAKNLVLQSFSL